MTTDPKDVGALLSRSNPDAERPSYAVDIGGRTITVPRPALSKRLAFSAEAEALQDDPALRVKIFFRREQSPFVVTRAVYTLDDWKDAVYTGEEFAAWGSAMKALLEEAVGGEAQKGVRGGVEIVENSDFYVMECSERGFTYRNSGRSETGGVRYLTTYVTSIGLIDGRPFGIRAAHSLKLAPSSEVSGIRPGDSFGNEIIAWRDEIVAANTPSASVRAVGGAR